MWQAEDVQDFINIRGLMQDALPVVKIGQMERPDDVAGVLAAMRLDESWKPVDKEKAEEVLVGMMGGMEIEDSAILLGEN